MGDDTAAWDSSVQEWLIDTGKVCGGGVASISDGCRLFGAATDSGGNAWDEMVKSGYQIEIVNEDGSTQQADCVESDTVKQAIVDGKAPNGVYIGGTKFKLAELKKDFEHNGQNYDIAILGKNKGGGFLIKTPNDNVVIAVYDEEKEQNKADALSTALNFADYLYQGGF